MTCGECQWHHALTEAAARIGWHNCLALPYPECIEFFSMPAASCSFPLQFLPRKANEQQA